MPLPQLVIGHQRYSSWSQRGWLALKFAGIEFETVKLRMFTDEFTRRITEFSPAGLVPALKIGDLNIWDSLAILEWAAEQPDATPLWPKEAAARGVARSICAEMHSGFVALRTHCNSNYGKRYKGFKPNDAVMKDVRRINQIWRDCREAYGAGGDFLFGKVGGADAFYAPVVGRFITYDLSSDAVTKRYMDAVRSHPAVEEWYQAANAENWIHPPYEMDLPERD